MNIFFPVVGKQLGRDPYQDPHSELAYWPARAGTMKSPGKPCRHERNDASDESRGARDLFWREYAAQIYGRGLSIRTAENLQPVRPRFVSKKQMSTYRKFFGRENEGWGRSQHPWQQLIANSCTFRSYQYACCAVPCTRTPWKRVETRYAGCCPDSPHWPPAESSVREAPSALRPRGAFTRGHKEHRRRSSLSWGGLGRKDGLMIGCRPLALLGWCSGLHFSLRIPSRTTSPTVGGDTICLAECSTRPLR